MSLTEKIKANWEALSLIATIVVLGIGMGAYAKEIEIDLEQTKAVAKENTETLRVIVAERAAERAVEKVKAEAAEKEAAYEQKLLDLMDVIAEMEARTTEEPN